MTVRMMVAALVAGSLTGGQAARAQPPAAPATPPAAPAATPAAQPQQKIDPSAKAILDQSAAALAKLQSIDYMGHRWAEGDLFKAIKIDFTGNVKVIRSVTDKARCPMLLKGHSKSMGPKDDTFWYAMDGNGKMTVASEEEKTVYLDRPLDQRIPAMNVRSQGEQVLFEPYFSPEPFKAEASADVIELEAPQDVHGEKCDVVKTTRKIPRGQGESVVRWFISSNDHIPRRHEQAVMMGEQPIKYLFDTWDVKINSTKAADVLLQVPEGWNPVAFVAPDPGRPDPVAQQQPPDVVPVPAPKIGLDEGNVPPDFSLSTSDGKTVKRDDLKTVTILAFLWSRNTPSGKSVPLLGEFQEKYKASNLKVYAIMPREKAAADGPKFLADNKATFAGLSGGDEALTKAYKVSGYPSFYVIGADGKVVGFIQNSDLDTVKKKLEELLQKATGSSGAAAAAGK